MRTFYFIVFLGLCIVLCDRMPRVSGKSLSSTETGFGYVRESSHRETWLQSTQTPRRVSEVFFVSLKPGEK